MFHPWDLLMLVFFICRKREFGCARAQIHTHTYQKTDTCTLEHTYTQVCKRIHMQIPHFLLQSERNHTTLFFWCVLQTAGAAARNAAINACNMSWIRALQLFELESADLITYNTAIEVSDWQQAEGRISTRDGYYMIHLWYFYNIPSWYMFFRIAAQIHGVSSRNQYTSQISCHCLVRAVLFGKGTQIRSESLWGTLTSIFF